MCGEVGGLQVGGLEVGGLEVGGLEVGGLEAESQVRADCGVLGSGKLGDRGLGLCTDFQ